MNVKASDESVKYSFAAVEASSHCEKVKTCLIHSDVSFDDTKGDGCTYMSSN